MASSLNQRRKGPRIAADVLAGGLWTWVLYTSADKGLNNIMDWVLFCLACLFIGVNVKDMADAITEPAIKDGEP